jgi:hypothetical protein
MKATRGYPTCEQRIGEELRGRLKEIGEALKDEEKAQEFEEGILAIDRKVIYRVEMSWGGPSDYFEIEVDPVEHQIVDIVYHFLDWFDGAEVTLQGEDFDLVEQEFSYLAEE